MAIYRVNEDGEFDGVFKDCVSEGADIYVDSAIGWIKVTEEFTSTVNGNIYAVTYNIDEEVIC